MMAEDRKVLIPVEVYYICDRCGKARMAFRKEKRGKRFEHQCPNCGMRKDCLWKYPYIEHREMNRMLALSGIKNSS